jgi:hypothetical protein
MPDGEQTQSRGAIRYCAAVDGSTLVGLRRVEPRQWYTWSVLHRGGAGTFATFHRTYRAALRGATFFLASAPHKEIMLTVELDSELPIGSCIP